MMEPEYVGVVEMAERLYDYKTNLAGQAIWPVVYDDPLTRHLYPPAVEECGYCSEPLADSVCEGNGWHCQDCRDEGNCPACNGAPS